MSRSVRASVSAARRWTGLYTRGLPDEAREGRRAEIESDLWEHVRVGEANGSGSGDTAFEILGRLVLGIPSDLSWRRATLRAARGGFTERRKAMFERIRGNWWVAVTALLALNSLVFGFLAGFSDEGGIGWAVMLGFAPAVLLGGGLMLRSTRPEVGTGAIVLGSLLAATAFWVIYTVVLALVIIIGGFWTGELRPPRRVAAA